MPDDESRPARSGLLGLVAAAWGRRELRFLAVGGANTVMAYLIFVGFHALLGDSVPYLVLLVPTYAVAVPLAFTSLRVLVFGTHGNVWLDFARYCLVQTSGFFLNAAVLALLVGWLSVPVVPAQLIALAILIVVTYFSHALFSFRRPAHQVGMDA